MKKTIILTVALTLATSNITFAAPKTTTLSAQNRAQAEIQARFEERCQTITNRIETKITRFDETKAKHIANYNNMVDRITKFDTRLKADGYDTTKLETDLATLNKYILQFSADYKTYIDALRATRGYTCGHSEGDFRTQLNQSKTSLKTVHTDAAKIRTFYRETIRQDLIDLKAQRNTNNNETTENSDQINIDQN